MQNKNLFIKNNIIPSTITLFKKKTKSSEQIKKEIKRYEEIHATNGWDNNFFITKPETVNQNLYIDKKDRHQDNTQIKIEKEPIKQQQKITKQTPINKQQTNVANKSLPINVANKSSPIAVKSKQNLLKPIIEPIIKPIIKQQPPKQIIPNKNKKVLIYQEQNMHTEVIGMIVSNLMDCDINIYHNHIHTESSCVKYYSKLFNKQIDQVFKFYEDNYDLIIILTSREIKTLTPKNINKYLLINHAGEDVNNNYFNVSLTPLVRSNYYILPIYQAKNNVVRSDTICIIGSMSNHQRDIQNIERLLSHMPTFKVYIFTRAIDSKTRQLLDRYKQTVIYQNSTSEFMIQTIKSSKYIFAADTINYTDKGIRGGILTGMIPLGLNNNVPIIMTRRLNNIYNLKGVLLYDKNIIELKQKLTNMDNNEYLDFLQKSTDDCIKINTENKLKWSLIKNKFFD